MFISNESKKKKKVYFVHSIKFTFYIDVVYKKSAKAVSRQII